MSLEHIFLRVDVFQRNISPNISKLQIHFDLFDKEAETEIGLQKKGILNAHLCLNAQTKLKYTKCDSLYTTICVHLRHLPLKVLANKAFSSSSSLSSES